MSPKGLGVVLSILLAASSEAASTQVAPFTYDVSTIKPHAPGDGDMSIAWGPTTYEARNVSLQQLLATAYSVRDWLIFGLPPWADKARYDISAKVSDGNPEVIRALPQEQRRAMIASLLQDRFHLKTHYESRIQPVYELSTLGEGTKLTPNSPAVGAPMQRPGSRWSIHNGQLTATAMTTAALCDNLSYQVERNIVDKTALTGTYDVTLKWTPEDKVNADKGLPPDAPPDIFTALREQLGLKLTPAKAPIPTLVIDKVTPPEAN